MELFCSLEGESFQDLQDDKNVLLFLQSALDLKNIPWKSSIYGVREEKK